MKIITMIKRKISDIFKPVLSDKTILEMNRKGLLFEELISYDQVQPNSVDLTLGGIWKKLKGNCYDNNMASIDPFKEINYDSGSFLYDNYKDQNVYKLLPGEFVLMASREVLNIPNGILSFVQGRSSIARLGIQTEQAGLIDAGFRGTITFEIYNQTQYPIKLYEGMRVAQVYFFKSQHAKSIYGSLNKGSKYQDQIDPTGSKIHMDFK